MSSSPTVAKMLVTALADQGVRTIWGVVGDALNPVTDAIREDERLEWIGVRHEEVAAFAAGAQAQLTGTLGVCMGTVGPGSVHLLNGLYDAKKSHAPVLAICGQVPLADLGSEMFQEVDNDLLFRDVAVFTRTITSPEHATSLLEQAVQSALTGPGVSVLTLPGDVGSMELPADSNPPHVAVAHPPTVPDSETVDRAARLIDDAASVTLLVGIGAREARDEVLALADRLKAPMVLTLKAKEGLERDNDFQVGQSGLIGNPAAQHAFSSCDLLLMVGTDFPYRDWYPQGKTVIQIEARPEHIGRRVHVDLGLVGHAAPTLAALSAAVRTKRKDKHLKHSRKLYEEWLRRQHKLARPDYDKTLVGRVREKFDNTAERIRPEALARAVEQCADEDAVFTTDTGMATVWLSRFVMMTGTRRLLGFVQPRLHGQRDATGPRRAGPRPHAAGDRLLRRRRPVDAARRPHDRRGLRPPGEAGALRQRQPGHGQARAGAGRPAGVRHRAAQPGLRGRRPCPRPARRARRGPRPTSTTPCAPPSRIPARCCSTS